MLVLSCFRWDTLSWPRKICDQVDITENQIEQDEQKFHKKLLDDQTQLEDKLDTLQVRIIRWHSVINLRMTTTYSILSLCVRRDNDARYLSCLFKLN